MTVPDDHEDKERAHMGSTVGQFDFILSAGVESPLGPGDMIVDLPMVRICLKHGVGADGRAPVISAQLTTENEIDGWISALKEDLDAVGERAKQALRSVLS
jgi:hypothetical protein